MRAKPKAVALAMEKKGQISEGFVGVHRGPGEFRECGSQSVHQVDI